MSTNGKCSGGDCTWRGGVADNQCTCKVHKAQSVHRKFAQVLCKQALIEKYWSLIFQINLSNEAFLSGGVVRQEETQTNLPKLCP